MVCALKRAVPPLLHFRLAVLDPKLELAREAEYHWQAVLAIAQRATPRAWV